MLKVHSRLVHCATLCATALISLNSSSFYRFHSPEARISKWALMLSYDPAFKRRALSSLVFPKALVLHRTNRANYIRLHVCPKLFAIVHSKREKRKVMIDLMLDVIIFTFYLVGDWRRHCILGKHNTLSTRVFVVLYPLLYSDFIHTYEHPYRLIY